MLKTFLYTSMLSSSLVFSGCCKSSLLNLDNVKEEAQEYYEKGEYNREIDKAISKAIDDLAEIKPDNNSIAVFDVDETALSSYEYTKGLGFGYTSATWNDWMLNAKSKAIPQTLDLYKKILSKGIQVVFITGREAEYYDATYKNLVQEGFVKFDTLITRKKGGNSSTALEFKSAVRRQIADAGKVVVMNIGDQQSDLEGGNSGIKVKLPNCLYVIP